MSLKAVLITQEAVVDQVKQLETQKAEMEVELEQLEIKLRNIEASLAENEQLRVKNQELLDQTLQNAEEEWTRRSTHFPDIHRRILESAATLVATPKK
jgi:regulator of replication initiation timing